MLQDLVKTFSKDQHLAYEDVLKVLDALETNFTAFTESVDHSKVQEFLYYNCHRFNRFSVPTPFVLEIKSKETFQRCLNILKSVEPTNVNTACLDIDRMIWEAFDLISGNCAASDLVPIVREMKTAQKPLDAVKEREFSDHKAKLKAYMSGYVNNNLVTKIQTSIPVSPVEKQTIIESVYNDVRIEVILIPKFYNSAQSILGTEESHVSIPISNSNWQNSICHVEIVYYGLLDPIKPAPPLSVPYPHEVPKKEWPIIFNEVYYIIENISWRINDTGTRIGRWLVAPSDLSSVTWMVYSNNSQIERIIKDPPNLVTRVCQVNQGSNHVKVESIDHEVSWHFKCLIIAQGKLGIGETNEALFWLNVGIEALFESRSSEMLASKNLPVDILNSGRSYWNSAKDLVSKQFPEVAEKIAWPEAAIGVPSWYAKIKFLSDEVGFSVERKLILAHYSKINRYRNSLFHGSRSARIESGKVEEAIHSYNWLIENYR